MRHFFSILKHYTTFYNKVTLIFIESRLAKLLFGWFPKGIICQCIIFSASAASPPVIQFSILSQINDSLQVRGKIRYTSWWLQYSLYTYSPLMRASRSLCDRSAALYFDIEKQIFDRLKNLRLMDQLLLVRMSKSFKTKSKYNSYIFAPKFKN